MKSLIAWLIRGILSLRYRITVTEKDLNRERGIIFIPNHPAEIDPIMVMSQLYGRFRPRPIVVEHYFYLPGAKRFMDLCGALPLPNFETTTNTWKIKRAEKTIQKIKEGLARGHNFLIYPSGHLKRAGYERVGGSLVHELIKACPQAKIALVRTTGLWGSSFSRIICGRGPAFWKALKKGLFVLLKNGIFFAPRRPVKMCFCMEPDDFPRRAERQELNRYLENWFNQYPDANGHLVAEEPVQLVSYSHFRNDVPQVKESEQKDTTGIKIPPKVRREVVNYLAELTQTAPEKITDETDLVTDLGFDSLDVGNVLAFLDEKFQVASLAPSDLKTVRDLCVAAVSKNEASMLKIPDYKTRKFWPKEDRPREKPPRSNTFPEAFLEVTTRLGKYACCADGLTGPLTYKDMRRAALILANKIRKMPGEYIGVMLPSSVASMLVVFATWLAGKTPAMLNWTSGVRALDHAGDLLKLKTIISSRRFLDRLDVFDIGKLESALVLLEDVKQGISFCDKIKGVIKAHKDNRLLMDELDLCRITPDDVAVILFTSGTESYPKAVPLTHRNILTNQKAGFSCVDLHADDIMLSVLPPFHSFGFSLTGILPILFGLKAFYAPDPTDGAAMARDIAHWKATVLCLAPSFYRNLFAVAEKEQFDSMRLFVTGAEKAPDDLKRLVKELGPDKLLLEGYGITECAPIVTITRTGDTKGVGQPLPTVEIITVNPETKEVLPRGSTGEICIRGPSVFSGYLGSDARNPFITVDGETYYCSGDIGHLSDDDQLIIEGRLKRFVKIGGEMISLGAIEDVLGRLIPSEDGPPCALGIVEAAEQPKLVLFSVQNLSKEQANKALRDAGFGRIVKIHEVRTVDAIPLTGTGKVHYRKLDELI